MALTFQRATKAQAKARIAIMGPAGSGKTLTALTLASKMGERVALIDTEHGSAAKYAGASDFTFDTLSLTNFHPERYIEAIKAAADAEFDVLVIDSASHEWNGPGGCLELHDIATTRNRGNSYVAWNDVTPLHTRFIEAILQSPMHVIATFRSKMDYVQSEEGGRKTVQKLGLQPVTRDGAEYEFDLVLDMDQQHTGTITKSRARGLADTVHRKPGAELAKLITAWLSDGVEVKTVGAEPPSNGASSSAPPPAVDPTPTPTPKADPTAHAYLLTLGGSLSPEVNATTLNGLLQRHNVQTLVERLENKHREQHGAECAHVRQASA